MPFDWASRYQTLDIAKFATFPTAKLRQPFGDRYDERIYGTAATSDAAIRIPVEQTRCIDATEARSAADAIGTLPGEGESIHMVIGAQHSMGHIIPAVLRLSGVDIARLHIATLTYSKQNAEDWASLIDQGKIKKLAIICSQYFAKTSTGIYDHSTALLLPRGAQIVPIRSHCKVLAMELADGRRIVAEGSANTRSAKTIEQVQITGNRDVYEFHLRWMTKHLEEFAAKSSKGQWEGMNNGEPRAAAIGSGTTDQ